MRHLSEGHVHVIVKMSDSELITLQPKLSCLVDVNQLHVHQEVELFEVCVGLETQNKYMVKNGQEVFYSSDYSGCFNRNCFGYGRPFDIKMADHGSREEVIHLNQPLKWVNCCSPGWFQELEVTSSPGNVIAYIRQEWSLWNPQFKIVNIDGDTMLRIKSPCFPVSCFSDVRFQILSVDGRKTVGSIKKQLGRGAKETDNFVATFPFEMDPSVKAITLGACFLIDHMFLEN